MKEKEQKQVQCFGSDRGSLTVELAMLFPLILLLLFLIFYTLLLAYEKTTLQSVLDDQASQAALLWGQVGTGGYEALVTENQGSPSQSPLYWQIGLTSRKGGKETQIADYVSKQLEERLLLTPRLLEVEVAYHNYFLYQQLTIEAELLYSFPLATLFSEYHGYRVRARAQSLVKNEAERIRTLDFSGELLDAFQVTSDLKQKYFQAIERGKSWIADFFKAP